MPRDLPQPTVDDIRPLIDSQIHLEGPLLPILHAIHEDYGHIPAMAVPLIADALNITRAEVHGVVSFYHDFRETVAGRHVVKLCRAEACQAMGATAVAEAMLSKLGIDWHDTTPDGAVTVEPVYCLGLCSCAPAAMVDGKVVGRVDAARIGRILEEAGA